MGEPGFAGSTDILNPNVADGPANDAGWQPLNLLNHLGSFTNIVAHELL